jgi:hypothetical protein
MDIKSISQSMILYKISIKKHKKRNIFFQYKQIETVCLESSFQKLTLDLTFFPHQQSPLPSRLHSALTACTTTISSRCLIEIPQ